MSVRCAVFVGILRFWKIVCRERNILVKPIGCSIKRTPQTVAVYERTVRYRFHRPMGKYVTAERRRSSGSVTRPRLCRCRRKDVRPSSGNSLLLYVYDCSLTAERRRKQHQCQYTPFHVVFRFLFRKNIRLLFRRTFLDGKLARGYATAHEIVHVFERIARKHTIAHL